MRDSRAPTSLRSATSNAMLRHGHLVQTKMKKLLKQLFFFYPYSVLKHVWFTIEYKKTSPIGLVLHFILRRERDSLLPKNRTL